MKIRTQFIVCIVFFSLILLVISASVATTEQQVSQIKVQEELANNIERGASNLNSVSIDYFLYQEDLQLSRWQSVLSSLSSDLASLKLDNAQQQTLANNVAGDLQNLNGLFDDVVSYLQSASRNVSVRIDPAFQLRWSSMAIQSQALAFDASQLSLLLDNQAHQINNTNILLILSLVTTFGAFLATIYFMFFRRTLKSVTELQNGINKIGSGNLDYVIQTKRKDEISELSHSFNKMTANLKEVTASKTDLEQAQVSLRESEQRWSTTLASIGDAVIAIDLSGKITFMNYVAEELTGWKLMEVSKKSMKTVFNIINEQTRKEAENPINRVLNEGVVVGLANHTVLVQKDGSEIPIDDSAAPIKDKDGETTGVVLVFRDITERKKAEEALKLRTEELEKTQKTLEKRSAEVEEYATRMEELAEERARKLKDAERLATIGATAGMVGHDIRNPLQAIIGDLFLAKSELSNLPDNDQKQNTLESLAEIEKNVDYINKIVADLQDFARPLNPRLQETDIRSLFNEIVTKNGVPKNIKLSIEVEDKAETLIADPDYLKRIFSNLTLNAVQAMPDGGKLTIRANADKQTNDVIITVKDTGVGIPEDVKPKLFTPMMTTKSKGQGFGLAVVKRMAEGLGGKVSFESTEGKGTTFSVRLPRQIAKQ